MATSAVDEFSEARSRCQPNSTNAAKGNEHNEQDQADAAEAAATAEKIAEILKDFASVPVITDKEPKVLDDIDINRGALELRTV